MDTELVTRAQQGDETAFAELMEAVGGRLHRIAYSILRDRALAEDATQLGLLQMWRKLPGLRDPARFEGWSYRFVVHACHAEARKAKRTLPQLAVGDETMTADDIALVHDRDQLERAFRRLPVDQRAVVVLRHYLDLPLDAIADALDIPTGTVNSRLHRAMDALRAVLEADARPAESRPSMPQKVTR